MKWTDRSFIWFAASAMLIAPAVAQFTFVFPCQVPLSANVCNTAGNSLTFPAPTVQGDLLYLSAPSVIDRLPKDATAGFVLTNSGTNNNPKWAANPGGPPSGPAGGDLTGTYPNPTLAATAVTAASYGSATQSPTFTVDAKGRLTLAANVTIAGVAPGGSAGGDLSGTFPNPVVAKINTVTLGSTTATSGNLLIGSGTQWVTNAMSGDVTIGATGVTAIGAAKVTSAMLRNSAALSLIGRSANSIGVPADILATAASDAVFRESGSTIGFGTISANVISAGTLNCARVSALTGDVTSSTGSCVTALANIPTATPVSGSLLFSKIAAPSAPAAGKSSVWVDTTALRLHDIDAGGTIGTTVVADTGAANNFLTAISTSGVISKAPIAAGTVTSSMLRDSALLSVIGRSVNSAGVPADIAAVASSDSILRESGSTIGFGTITASSIGAGTLNCARLPALIGDVTSSAGSCTTVVAKINGATLGTVTATSANLLIANGTLWQSTAMSGDTTISAAGVVAIGTAKVTSAMLRDSAALSVIGRSANSSGVPADIAAAADGNILRRSGTSIGFGSIDLADTDAVGSTILPRANGGTQVSTGAIIKIVQQVFTASGTYTPTTGMLYAKIECQGSGGSGGGAATSSALQTTGASGGGAGGYSQIISTAATIGASQTVTVNNGGAAPSAGANNGNVGGSVSVGTICIANGGAAGNGSSDGNSAPGVPGGATGTGTLVIAGGASGFGQGGLASSFPCIGGTGGSSMFGAGGPWVVASTGNSAGNAGQGYGGGGGGGCTSNTGMQVAGGAGAKGAVLITEYLNQ